MAAVSAVAVPLISPVLADDDDDHSMTAKDMLALTEPLAASMVRVEITPQYDKAESPGNNWSGRYNAMQDDSSSMARMTYHDFDELIKEERPAEQAGYVIAPRRVLTADPDLHPRFIKDISVRFGDRVVKASIAAYPKEHGMVILELAEDLPGTSPLSFDPSLEGPYFASMYYPRDVVWSRSISPVSTRAAATSDGRTVESIGYGVIINKDGKPVGFCEDGYAPVGDGWKTSPTNWPAYSVSELKEIEDKVAHAADDAVLRTTLNFRSPRTDNSAGGYGMYDDYYGGGGSGDDQMTEWNGSSVLIDPTTVVVLANLEPKVTARLERIRLFTPDGTEATATFDGTLKDYGAFIAKLDKAMPTPARACPTPLLTLRDMLLLKAEVSVRGETRTAYYSGERFTSYFFGRKRAVFPAAPGTAQRSWESGSAPANFVFDPDARLVAIPMEIREKVAAQDGYGSWGYGRDNTRLVPVSSIAEAISARPGSLDPENRPLTEEEENRLAWLGVELQPMDPDLARVNDVMEETNGGRTGAMISYIYPGSPAEKAGLEMGDILLRLHVEGQPKPLDVTAQQGFGFGAFAEFFQRMDEVPLEMFDRIPSPWGTAETPLTRALTDIGFGTPFKADVFRSGEVFTKDFAIEQGPPHYASAKRFKSETAGMTTRNLTYEVRRFYQLTPEDPGVIVSKVESGEKAAVAGIRPFEIITAVNDEPVKSVDDLQRLIAPGGELRLSIKRMSTGRLVKVRLDAAEGAGGSSAEPAAADDAVIPSSNATP